jgi:hypothetical protein
MSFPLLLQPQVSLVQWMRSSYINALVDTALSNNSRPVNTTSAEVCIPRYKTPCSAVWPRLSGFVALPNSLRCEDDTVTDRAHNLATP